MTIEFSLHQHQTALSTQRLLETNQNHLCTLRNLLLMISHEGNSLTNTMDIGTNFRSLSALCLTAGKIACCSMSGRPIRKTWK
jgi:hypothetical protein